MFTRLSSNQTFSVLGYEIEARKAWLDELKFAYDFQIDAVKKAIIKSVRKYSY